MKHSIEVTIAALPSVRTLMIPVIFKIVLANGAANEASSSLKANPISAYLKAQVSLVPSPQNETNVSGYYYNKVIKSPLLFGFIRAYTFAFLST